MKNEIHVSPGAVYTLYLYKNMQVWNLSNRQTERCSSKLKAGKQNNAIDSCLCNQIKYRQTGITLIALVVTIVVLLILAGITISTVFSENGLIQKVQQAKDVQLIATYQDRIEIVCLDWLTDKTLDESVDIDDLWVKMKDAGIILDIERDVEKLDDEGNYVITVPEGYKFQIHINENGDAEVEYIGKEDALLPYIQSVEVIGKTTNSVTVKVTVTREGENLTLSYYYKKLDDPEENYVAIKENVTDKAAEITGLESETIYELKIIAKNENGENEKVIELTVEGIIGADEGLKEGAIIASVPNWDSNTHTASITLSKGSDVASNLNIEWQINKIEEGNWTTGIIVTGLNHNDVVYARLTDGINYGQEASVTIKDEIDPITARLTVGTVGETSIAVTAQGADDESGLYSYAFQRSTTSATTGFTTVATQANTATSLSYTYTGLTEGTTYYLRVIVTDRAGNTETSTSATQTTKKSYPTVNSLLKQGNHVTYPSSKGNLACRVLYDNSSGYGVQLITNDTVTDSYALGSSTFTTAMNAYNNAISTLNSAVSSYNNSVYSTVRCVGSVPNNPNQDSVGYFTSSYSYMSSYNGKFKDTDTNYETDYNQMGTLGIRDIGKFYWLASRKAQSSLSISAFGVRLVVTSGSLSNSNLCNVVNSSPEYSTGDGYGLRPIFTLKSTVKVTGGNGTESSPYTLGI